jgi:hypothetical protein
MLQCMMRHGGRGGVAPQLLLGLGVMFLGLLLVLDNFGLLQARRIVRFWPVLLVGMGLFRLYHSLRARTRPCGVVLIPLGLGLLLLNFGLVSFRQGLAMFLLVAGAVMALRATRREPAGLAPMAIEPDPDLDLFSFMSYISRAVGAAFRGGQVTAIMGFCEIDLRGARIDGEAVVNVFAFWGGMEIRVPPGWLVEGRGVAVLGAFEDKSRRPDDDRQKLIVTGMVIMGGVEVKN